MMQLSTALRHGERFEEAIAVQKAVLSYEKHLDRPPEMLLPLEMQIASCLGRLGRFDEAYEITRRVYAASLEESAYDDDLKIQAAIGCATSLSDLQRHGEATAIFKKVIPLARRVYGPVHQETLTIQSNYVLLLLRDMGVSLDDLAEGAEIIEDSLKNARRILGVSHPITVDMQRSHTQVDKKLALMKEIYARNPRAKSSEGLFRRP